MQNRRYENKDYKALLLNLGVTPNLIPDNLNYSQTYKAFCQAMIFFKPKLIIKDVWQLRFFSSSNEPLTTFLEKYKDVQDNWGNSLIHYASWASHIDALIWFENNHHKQLLKKDYYGRNLAHYAAWSGSAAALTWFKDHYPEQLFVKDNNGKSPLHYAAWSDNIEALAWFKDNYPEQLFVKDNNGKSPVHDATQSGNVEALTCFKDTYPNRLFEKDNNGSSPVHYAAWSGKAEALAWFKDNYPEQLFVKDNKGRDIKSYAALSNSIQQLELALLYSETPTQFSFFNNIRDELQETSIVTLLKLLECNYSITKVDNLSLIDKNRSILIESFLERNKQIKQEKVRFLAFYQQRAQPYWLPKELEMNVLKHMLPPNVDEAHVYYSILPHNRALLILKDTLRASWIAREDSKAFNNLINILDKTPHKLTKEIILKQIDSWEKELQARQKNQFFKATLPASQLKCISLIKGMLTKEEEYQVRLN